MRKRITLIFILCTVLFTPIFASPVISDSIFVNIDLNIKYIDPGNNYNEGVEKIPVVKPVISIKGDMLYLMHGCYGCMLSLVSANGEEVYSEYVEFGTDIIELPEYLSGEYEIRLVRDDICFYGMIGLS
ncbi:hypothetical protein [Prevotella sp. HCN-7019]|uniref:hypothetical protein n=1 Tax=Prevotella sp. HCN-7019 TaxID=3134668 RepID=UPI0030BABB14